MTTEHTLRHIPYSPCDGVATLTLNRAEARNAMDVDFMRDLSHVASNIERDRSVLVVLLLASGTTFSVGGDIKCFAGFGDDTAAKIKDTADTFHQAISSFARMAPPLVVAVNGFAAGGGFSLAMAGDLVLAGQSARFTMAYSGIGFSPDGGASYHLPRLIGLRRATELILTDRVLSAAEALDWGLIMRVVPDDELASEARKVAQQLATRSMLAQGSSKKLLRVSHDNSLEQQLELEARSVSKTAASADGLEGMAAFIQKRRPKFGDMNA
jgi:2-(1,2-epoxy-1,2-dihydrophenyl)acetyl-CoA isomerase